MKILIDCDDVLLDWQKGFRSWLQEKYSMRLDPAGPRDWSLSEWLGMSDEACLNMVKRFNFSVQFGYLNALPDARGSISHLSATGREMYVITSCGSALPTLKKRRRNLTRHFGTAFSDVINVPLGGSKQQQLASFEPSIWIEDNYANALAGVECGHHTFMMRRNHNRKDESASDDRITWVDDWHELISRLP